MKIIIFLIFYILFLSNQVFSQKIKHKITSCEFFINKVGLIDSDLIKLTHQIDSIILPIKNRRTDIKFIFTLCYINNSNISSRNPYLKIIRYFDEKKIYKHLVKYYKDDIVMIENLEDTNYLEYSFVIIPMILNVPPTETNEQNNRIK
jgi:hypothetical protein